MNMQKIVLRIYIKGMKKPLCTCDVENENVLDTIYQKVKNDDIVKFGQIIFAKSEFRYATITYEK